MVIFRYNMMIIGYNLRINLKIDFYIAYKISIFERGVMKWNITYTEYVPHSFDANIEHVHKTSPDGLYVASTHNGEVLSTDSSSGNFHDQLYRYIHIYIYIKTKNSFI